MKNKEKQIYGYAFPSDEEIESCYNCPCGEQFPDYGELRCNITKRLFTLKKGKHFPDDCPMEEVT
jgi:hypothetical protein